MNDRHLSGQSDRYKIRLTGLLWLILRFAPRMLNPHRTGVDDSGKGVWRSKEVAVRGLCRVLLLVGLVVSILALRASRLLAAEGPATSQPSAQAPASAPSGSDKTTAGKPAEPDNQAGDWWDMDRIMRGWDGAKDTLSAKGLSLSLTYTDAWQNNARGGADTRDATRYLGIYGVILQLDTQKAGLWKGGLFNISMEGTFGHGADGKVGDLLGVTGTIRTYHDYQVSTAWYEQKFLDEKVRIKAGKLDPTADFDNNRYANNASTQFLYNGLCNNATLPFPDYSLGLQAVVAPVTWAYGQVGLFDADGKGGRTGFDTTFRGPAHFFLMNEYGLTPTFGRGKKTYPGAYRVGYWYDPTPKEFFIQPDDDRARMSNGDWGTYLSFDQRVWKENDREGDEQGLGLFFRYGWASGKVNEVSNSWSYGLSYTGLIPSRNEDVLAAGFSHASLSEALGHVEPGMECETAAEFFYNIHINKWVQLSPDMQVIVDPGGSDELRNAIVVGLRLGVYF
jgi:porin